MKITLDTNVAEDQDLLGLCQDRRFDVGIVPATAREVSETSFQADIRRLSRVPETGVWDESGWDAAALWVSDPGPDLERILDIMSSGSLSRPELRTCLTKEQRGILRDAMIFQGHVRARRDVLVTKDRKHILNHKQTLEREFGTRIMTPDEFRRLLRDMKTTPGRDSWAAWRYPIALEYDFE